MLCPKCRVEARLVENRTEEMENGVYQVMEFACRNKNCADFGNIVVTDKKRREEQAE